MCSLSMMSYPEQELRLQKIKIGHHILGVYPNRKKEIEDALIFLEDGIERNEIVMLISDYISKDHIREMMQNSWNYDVGKLEEKNRLLLRTTSEWYFDDESFSKKHALEKWKEMAKYARSSDSIGLRVFADTSYFFRNGYNKELINYENSLEPILDLPVTCVCAYTYQNMDSLNTSEFHSLQNHHNKIWI